MKKFSKILLVILLAIGGFLLLPSNYYLRRAIVHLMPKIDQYPIFDNRVVKASDPAPWPLAEDYNNYHISEELLPYFDKMGTIAFLVIQNGELLFEQYWEGYSPQLLSNSFSMAKSIVSLGIGCAIDDGFIRSVDQPVSDFYPQYTGYGGKTMTLRHLLTMSAGVDFDEAYNSPFSPTTKLYYGNDLSAIALDMKEVEEPGGYFYYQSGVTQLLAFILEKATGERISDYVSRKLWTPMHAEEDALWSLDRADGMEKAYCCFNSNARDFARFGQLILNKGSWDGKQLISQEYLKEAITPDTSLLVKGTDNTVNHIYGYQFWQFTRDGYPINYLRGILGQYIFAIPHLNAVIVRLGHKRSETRTEQLYPDDIDVWMDAGIKIIDRRSNAGEVTQEIIF